MKNRCDSAIENSETTLQPDNLMRKMYPKSSDDPSTVLITRCRHRDEFQEKRGKKWRVEIAAESQVPRAYEVFVGYVQKDEVANAP